MNKKYISLLGIFILHISVAVAQKLPCNFALTLTVYQNNVKYEHAEVFIEKSHRIDFTDQNGQVNITKLCDSIIEVEIQTNFIHDHVEFNLTKNIPQEIYLTTVDSVNAVFIQAHKSQTNITTHPGYESKSIQSFSALIQNLPQVQILTTGRTISKPIIQGMMGLRVPIYVDGMRLEGQSWGMDHSPELGATGQEKIEIFHGVDALILGADVWGNAITVRNDHSYLNHEIDYIQTVAYQSNGGVIMANGSFTFGQENSKKRIKNNGTYIKYLAQVSKDYQTPLGILENTASREYLLAGGNTIHLNKSVLHFHLSFYDFTAGIYSGSHIGNITDLNFAIHHDTPTRMVSYASYAIAKPYQHAQQIHGIAHWKNENLLHLSVNLSYQQNLRQEFDPHRNTLITFPQLDILQQTISLTSQITWNLGKIICFSGLNGNFQKQQFAGFYFVPEYISSQQSVYTKFKFPSKSNTNFEHTSIVRSDILQRNGYHWYNGQSEHFNQNFSGFSGGYSFHYYNVKTRTHPTFNIDILQLWRPAAVNEMYSKGVHHGSASYELGNINLKPETGQKLNFTYELNHSYLDYLPTTKNQYSYKLNISGFSQYSQNFIHLFPMMQPILTVRGAFPGFEYKQLPTIYSGAEIAFEITKNFNPENKHHTSLTIGSKYSITHAKITSTNSYPPLIPGAYLTSNMSLKLRTWQIGLSYKYQFKQIFYTANSDIALPPAGYQVFGFTLETPKLGKSKAFYLNLQLDNLFNAVYRDYLDRFRYFIPMPGRNIGIKLNYRIHHHKEHKDIK